MKKVDEESMERVNAKVKWIQERSGFNQKEFAASLGVNYTQYNNWMGNINRLSLNGALALNRVYGTSLDFLYCGRIDTLPAQMQKDWLSKLRDESSNSSSDNPE